MVVVYRQLGVGFGRISLGLTPEYTSTSVSITYYQVLWYKYLLFIFYGSIDPLPVKSCSFDVSSNST